MSDDIMPHDDRAEQMVLASLLIDASDLDEITWLTPDRFYASTHRRVYEEMISLHASGLPLDAGLLAERVPGTAALLGRILDDPGPAGSIVAAARIIEDCAIRRRLVEQANAIIKQSTSKTSTAKESLKYASQAIELLIEQSPAAHSIENEIYDAERMLEAYGEYVHEIGKNRLLTGIRAIDRTIRGISGGEVLTIIARAGSYKTAFLQNILINYSRNSAWQAIFFSLEMPIPSVTERYLQMVGMMSGREIERVWVDPAESSTRMRVERWFREAGERLRVVPSRVGLRDIPRYVRACERRWAAKVGVIGIDYLGLVDAPGDTEYARVSEVARGAKALAKALGIPVVLLSQTSRLAGDGSSEVSLEHGRGSGAIEEAADFVLGLWRGEDETGRQALVCRVLKNRKGAAGGTWRLDVDPETMIIGAEAEEFQLPIRGHGRRREV